jgi:Uma2 family endonuclease
MATHLKQWTLAELHSLPDDGNKYELIHGELFVTPAPTDRHETIISRLARLVDRYVEANGLGLIYRPRAVFRFAGSEVEPDLMVRREAPEIGKEWEKAPLPILIVEVFSPFTRRRDQTYKRDCYVEARIPEYWMIDAEGRAITSVRPGEADHRMREELTWHPPGAPRPLVIAIAEVFP